MSHIYKNPDSRRLRRFGIGNETLTAILRGRIEVVPGQFPEDAKITCAGADSLTLSVFVYVWSSEFDLVPDGAVIPDCGLIKLRSVPKDEVKPGDSGESGESCESSESWRQRPSLFQ